MSSPTRSCSPAACRRWGSAPDDYLLAGAPPGIKFALGENPKQSNFQNPRPRYPATRMGVANLIRERFLAARDYRKRQEEYRKAAAVKGANATLGVHQRVTQWRRWPEADFPRTHTLKVRREPVKAWYVEASAQEAASAEGERVG